MSENPPDDIPQARQIVGPDFVEIDDYLGNEKFKPDRDRKTQIPGEASPAMPKLLPPKSLDQNAPHAIAPAVQAPGATRLPAGTGELNLLKYFDATQ
jgi:hypothetical protein